MSISIPGRVIVFDFGEVISISPTDADRSLLEQATGLGDRLWEPYWEHRHALDQGRLSVVDYWARVAEQTGSVWSPSRVQRIWSIDFRGWLSMEDRTIDLLDELHEGGTRMALLSNAGFDFGGPFRHSPMGRYFEQVFLSAELDLIKPDRAIYEHVIDELGITPAEFVFVDNKAENVEPVIELGGTGHHFTGVDGLRAFLLSLT